MKIAFYASSLVSAYWNGAATYYRGIVRALAGRGHHITFFEPDAFERQQHRDMEDPPWADVRVYPATHPGVARALEEGRGADLIIKASGVGVFDEWLEAGVLEHQGPGTLVAFWDVDAPATLDRVRRQAGDAFRPLIGQYDIVFTYGGGPPVVEAYESLGARRCVPIYNALDPTTHYPVPPNPRFNADLAFLGNRLPDREARVEKFFLEAALAMPDGRFLLGGSGWGDRSLPPNVTYLGHVYTADHNAFNVTPRAVLNISRESMARYGYSPATRVFEAAGAGACLITDAWEGLDQFLEPQREVLVARSGQEVVEHLRTLSPARARRIGERARQRMLAEHTYDHRALDVERALDAVSRRPARGERKRVGGPPGEAPAREPAEVSRASPTPPDTSPPLRIVILGLSITSSWGNGHATTYRGLVRELSRRGHQVTFLERDVPWYAANRDLPCPPFGTTHLYGDLPELRRRFAGAVGEADGVIVGSYVPQGVAVGDWVLATASGVTAFYDIDTPVTLAKLRADDFEYLDPRQISAYDLYLSFTGGPTLERLEREYGAPRARPLYCSFDPALYQPQQSEPRWDLGYMGTYSADRQPPLGRLLLDPARQWPEGRFVVAGPQYPAEIAWPVNCERIEHLPPAQHREFYTRLRFTLNITRQDMVAAGYSPSVRLFEAAACGTPIITDRWEGLEAFFEPHREILVADSAQDVTRWLREMGEDERRAMASRARRRALAEHTAQRRAETLERYLLTAIADKSVRKPTTKVRSA